MVRRELINYTETNHENELNHLWRFYRERVIRARQRKHAKCSGKCGSAFRRPTHGRIRVSDDQPDSHLLKLAKLSRAQAEDAALQHTPGKVIGTELAEENQFLVWQVEVLEKDATTKELTIDAGNGKVLAMEQGNEKHQYIGRGDDAEETASN